MADDGAETEASEPRSRPDPEARDYFAQIEAIQTDDTLSDGQREMATLGLQRQLLNRQALQNADLRRAVNSPRLGLLALLLLVAGGVFVYAQVGRPDLTRPGALKHASVPTEHHLIQAQSPSDNRELAMQQLVDQLAARLTTDRAEDPQGWLIYARSLMSLRRFDEALTAYDRVVVLTDQDPQFVEERARAQDFVRAQSDVGQMESSSLRGPTAEDIAAAQNMSDADRAAMIEGMVEGLSARLADNPNDPAGWARLLRARSVLGQTDQAEQDIARMRAAFADDPETVNAILVGTDWE